MSSTEPGRHQFFCRWGASSVVFGRGTRHRIADLTAHLPRPLGLVASPSQMRTGVVDELNVALGNDVTAEFTDTVVHAPRATCDAAAKALAGCATLVVVGGGAALSVAKVVGVEHGAALAALPTTFSGSEMTGLYGISEGGRKPVSWDSRALPAVVVYDPELVASLPAAAAHASAVNCLAHAVEAAWSPASSPLAPAVAQRCADALGAGMATMEAGGLGTAADDLLLAGWLGGIALTVGAMGVHHAVCHVLGGRYGVSHGLLHALVLPAAMRFNATATATIQAQLVASFPGADRIAEPWEVVDGLLAGWGLPRRLADLGVSLDDVDGLAAAVAASGAASTNPVPVQARMVATLLDEIR